MQFFMTITLGNDKHLKGAHQSIWRHLNDINRSMDISDETWEKVYDKFDERFNHTGNKRVGKHKVNRAMSVLELAKQIKDEETAPPPPQPAFEAPTFLDNEELRKEAEEKIASESQERPDYDSYYTAP